MLLLNQAWHLAYFHNNKATLNKINISLANANVYGWIVRSYEEVMWIREKLKVSIYLSISNSWYRKLFKLKRSETTWNIVRALNQWPHNTKIIYKIKIIWCLKSAVDTASKKKLELSLPSFHHSTNNSANSYVLSVWFAIHWLYI